MAPSKFEQASNGTTLKVVGMDKVEYLRFSSGGKLCLGTQDLNSCTAVIVVSKDAAILAHIAPRPSSSHPNQATGDHHAKAKMAEMTTLLRQHFNHFESGPGGILVYAVYKGQTALQDQKQIIEAYFKTWKLPLTSIPYKVLNQKETGGPGKGEILIDARNGPPSVWLEDKLVGQVKMGGLSGVGLSTAESSKAGSLN